MLLLIWLLTVFQSFCSHACMNSVTISFALIAEDSFFAWYIHVRSEHYLGRLHKFDLDRLYYSLNLLQHRIFRSTFDRLQNTSILITTEPLLTSNLGKPPKVVIIPSSMTCLRNRDHFSP